MSYNFAAQKAKGQRGEAALDRWLSQCFTDLRAATPKEEARGIDRVGVFPATGKTFTIQIKRDDRAIVTGNAFIETVSVSVYDRTVSAWFSREAGWVHTCQADLLLYFLPQVPRIYLLQPRKLRELLPTWEESYPSRRIPNGDYQTIGLLVPLIELAFVADAIAQ